MRIRIADDGRIFLGENALEREASAQDLIDYAAEIEAAKEAVALQADLPWRLKAVVKALVKTINLRLPAGQKITAEELKEAIRSEL